MGVLFTEQTLARTYSHPSVADSYDIVQQYREVLRHNPDKGATAIARQLSLPRGRVRPWLDGGKPDPVHAIEIATDHGWLADDCTPTVRSLSRLIACVFATGSIAEQWFRPSWAPSELVTREQIQADLDEIGVSWDLFYQDRAHQTTELRPTAHSTVLG